MVRVYLAFSSGKESWHDIRRVAKDLPATFQHKVLSFQRLNDAVSSLYGKLLLSRALHDFGLTANLDCVKFTPYGRPYINDSIDFNISHAGSYVVCACCDSGYIGVDVEKIAAVDLSDFKTHLSDEETDLIENSLDPYLEFYKIWTMKEAISKADGRGLGISFKNLKIESNTSKFNNKMYYLNEIVLEPGYVSHVATDVIVSEVKITSMVLF